MSSYSKWAQLFHGFSFGRRFGYMYTFFSNTLEELKKVCSLRAGLRRWIVGNGLPFHAWHNPWIPTPFICILSGHERASPCGRKNNTDNLPRITWFPMESLIGFRSSTSCQEQLHLAIWCNQAMPTRYADELMKLTSSIPRWHHSPPVLVKLNIDALVPTNTCIGLVAQDSNGRVIATMAP
ncbi:hypothetical protein M9H77_14366 [Catharanthus roseus]|uniref:Uncharacterized protein n=1 Tax=Catharanthus roseus TaxID=4058 RepID=A0ACC0BMT7_CATRO|nr:hypothetical protein M9H77_14366 [Catharanthus roseus]